jgi:hypothetical protein
MLKVHCAWCFNWKFVCFGSLLWVLCFLWLMCFQCVFYHLYIICIVSMFVIFYVSYVLYGWCLMCVCVLCLHLQSFNCLLRCLLKARWKMKWWKSCPKLNYQTWHKNFHYDSLFGLGLWISNNICIIKLKQNFLERFV